MTRVVVDAQTTERLRGVTESLELCDEAGNVLGTFSPSENSPAFRAWLKGLDHGLSEEEVQRRINSPDKLTTEQVLERLRGSQP
jgi:hypothetical protein